MLSLGLIAASAGTEIRYNEYSASPTIGNGNGEIDGPASEFGAMAIFIDRVRTLTRKLDGEQEVVFKPDQGTPRSLNALRPGVQFSNGDAFSEPSWGFLYNSMPFAMSFSDMLLFLYKKDGINLAQGILDARNGTQVAFPVVSSTMQGSGYFPKPLGRPLCREGDAECLAHGNGIGLAGLCTSGWEIRYLNTPEDVLRKACDMLVGDGNNLKFSPPTGGVAPLKLMQNRSIQGFEFVTPVDDLQEFFPINADPSVLDCENELDDCTQNIGQIGARYAHYPGWHQPFLFSWMHIDKSVWEGLSEGQRLAIKFAAGHSVSKSHTTTESMQCQALRQMIDFNENTSQLNRDGSERDESARITVVPWREEDLETLREATTAHMESLMGPTGEAREFAIVYKAMHKVAGIPVAPGDLGPFPGESCALESSSAS